MFDILTCWLFFCNSSYCDLPNKDFRSLQALIKSSAQVVKRISHWSYERVTPIIKELNFLSFKARIMYKICLLIYKTVYIGDPKYLADILLQRNSPGSLHIRSSTNRRLVEPWISRFVSVNRNFEYFGPRRRTRCPKRDDLQETAGNFLYFVNLTMLIIKQLKRTNLFNILAI